MQSHELLIQAAELLEKTAAHLEETEGAAHRSQVERQNAEAAKIATQLTSLTGSPVEPQTVSKMAGLGEDVSAILQKLAGGTSVDSMGGPAMAEKTAGNLVDDADSRFVGWLSTT